MGLERRLIGLSALVLSLFPTTFGLSASPTSPVFQGPQYRPLCAESATSVADVGSGAREQTHVLSSSGRANEIHPRRSSRRKPSVLMPVRVDIAPPSMAFVQPQTTDRVRLQRTRLVAGSRAPPSRQAAHALLEDHHPDSAFPPASNALVTSIPLSRSAVPSIRTPTRPCRRSRFRPNSVERALCALGKLNGPHGWRTEGWSQQIVSNW